ncbi:MAG: class I mannose-6-phosphate isomerase [Bacteroidales bacterium]|nr:class I mannose-6-phosphate isomerase [Bacteroidales bacterium]
MELYPLIFNPILKDKIWGGHQLERHFNKSPNGLENIGESWELSGVEGDVSEVSNGFLAGNSLEEIIEVYMAELLGENIYEKYGGEFPLLFKLIDASDDLSVQVHPNDELAKERHNAYGKTEMWYILEAKDDAELVVGFNQEMNRTTYLNALNDGRITDVIQRVKVKKGDVVYIPSGRVHAIGKGIVLAEIQQTSDITYRIYDWNRIDNNGNRRELHTDLALDAIDFSPIENVLSDYNKQLNESTNLIDSEYFTTNLLSLSKTIETDYSLLDSFVVYMCIDGQVQILMNNLDPVIIHKGQTVLIPAIAETVRLTPQNTTEIIEVYIKPDKIGN